MSTAKSVPDSKKAKLKSKLKFLNSLSPEYLESLQAQYRQNPESVTEDFRLFFEILELAESRSNEASSGKSNSDQTLATELRIKDLIEGYRMRGHLLAHVDPLGLHHPPIEPHLDLSDFQLNQLNRSSIFQTAKEIGLSSSNLDQIVQHLKKVYCNFIGVEYHFIRDEKIRSWLMNRIESTANTTHFTSAQKLRMLQDLFKASIFENFLQTNYTGQKRFSLEGAEALIPAIKHGISACAILGAKEMVIGMAHRGRLNVLANVMEKPYQEIFAEFEGAELPKISEAMGDVKYHQGYSNDITTPEGHKVHLSLAPNPSHLEWVNPVVEGIVRAKQDFKYGKDRNAVVPLLIHGDAAVIGQGVVPETLNLAHLNGYRTGGTIHLVINNQIGFTTLPRAARSSMYCTDHGKGFQCPVFHVNGDQIEDVVHVIQIAAEYRMKFKKDVFIDMWCYRKYGHNEGDEPRFTQPMMYRVIEQHPSPLDIYIQKLTNDRSVEQSEVDKFSSSFKETLDHRREETKSSPRVIKPDMFRGLWEGFELSSEPKMISNIKTAIKPEVFQKVVDAIHHIPADVKPLPKFKRMLEHRKKRIQEQDEIDWAVGEQLALGSLILEGTSVRLSGQDCIRGTFSQRHIAMRDVETGKRYYFLQALEGKKADINVFDSPLSEAAVMGFDYGYSMAQPKALVMWEGQFGDFANSAQVIIDQFIISAEAKWYRMSGLVLLLPHGYEGQGPEHSSARLERFLQLSAQNNIQVCYPTTPAQYFHLLRRQIHRNFRKPLIVMTPKSPLRMPEVVSNRDEFINSSFQNILITGQRQNPKRVVLCSGKIYWDLIKEAKAQNIEKDILFIRMEQIYPLDKQQLRGLHELTQNAPWIWVQEEPKNMGAWFFMRLNLLDLGVPLTYVGRPPAASPATGSHLKHEREQRQLIEEGLGL